MKILAVWERPIANERYGGIFCLTDENQLLHVSHETEYNGTDKNGNQLRKETGTLEISNAFHEEDRFDIGNADRWMRHFGGVMIARFC